MGQRIAATPCYACYSLLTLASCPTSSKLHSSPRGVTATLFPTGDWYPCSGIPSYVLASASSIACLDSKASCPHNGAPKRMIKQQCQPATYCSMHGDQDGVNKACFSRNPCCKKPALHGLLYMHGIACTASWGQLLLRVRMVATCVDQHTSWRRRMRASSSLLRRCFLARVSAKVFITALRSLQPCTAREPQNSENLGRSMVRKGCLCSIWSLLEQRAGQRRQ